jgi:hypothetical protein
MLQVKKDFLNSTVDERGGDFAPPYKNRYKLIS